MHIHSTHAVLICVCERKWINALFLGRGGRGGLCRQLTRGVWFRVLFTWVESIALAHSPHSFPKVTSALAPHFTTYSCKLIGGCFTFSSKKSLSPTIKKKRKKRDWASLVGNIKIKHLMVILIQAGCYMPSSLLSFPLLVPSLNHLITQKCCRNNGFYRDSEASSEYSACRNSRG